MVRMAAAAVPFGTATFARQAYRGNMKPRSPLYAAVALGGFLATAVLVKALAAVVPPTVTSVTPAPIVASATAQVLRVTGTGFAPGLVVELMAQGTTETFSGAAIQGQRATSFEISVVLAQPGAASLVVRNTDGGVSEPFALTVVGNQPQPADPAPQPLPVIDRIDPDKATRSTVAIPLILSGKQFATGLQVTMTDPTGTVTVIQGTAIEAVTPTTVRFQAVLEISGEYTFSVTNPKGKPSNSVTVTVT
jgi:hypothetical protein